MTTKRIAMLLTMILVVGACGSGDDAADDTSSTTTLPETSTTVVPETTITTTTAAPEPEQVEVLVHLLGGPDADPSGSDCSEVWPVIRRVEAPAVLKGAMEALLAGPTADERGAGYDSWFAEDVGWTVDSVTISDGVAYIDFAEDSPYINNASTSCGSMSFLAQLDMTATQFPAVDRAIYSIGGDAEAFYGWLQRDVPRV
jgi:hypothetical protein